MTTAREAKRLFRPLLERNNDVALIGRLLAIKPVHHILRGVFLDATWDRNRFRPTWAAVFLFHPNAGFHFNWSAPIYAGTSHGWLISDKDVEKALGDAVEREALPLLRPMQTIDDFAAFATKDRFDLNPLNSYLNYRTLIDIARGDFDAAGALCKMMAKRRSKSSFWAEQYDPILTQIWPLVKRRDKATLAKILHEWEFEAVKREKLENIWEPTPFPMELN